MSWEEVIEHLDIAIRELQECIRKLEKALGNLKEVKEVEGDAGKLSNPS